MKASGRPAHCVIYSDGGARGNPGPAAAGGVIIRDDGTVVGEISEYLGIATNNVAEYRALLLVLRLALDAGCTNAEVCLDSELVVRQLNGLYRVKDAKIMPLHTQARALLRRFEEARIVHIPREKNKQADKLVNAALDARASAERAAESPAD